MFPSAGQTLIENLVLKAKIGSKETIKLLWECHLFIIDTIFYGLSKFYPFMKDNKLDIYHDYYLFFWEAINSYDFNDDHSFSYYVRIYILNKNREHLSKMYFVPQNKQPTDNEIIIAGTIKKPMKDRVKTREDVLKGFRSMTQRQKRAMVWNFFFYLPQEKCAELLDMNTQAFRRLSKRGWANIQNAIWGEKRGKRRIFREKVHRVFERLTINV